MSKNNKRYGRIEILDYYSSFDATVFESNVEEIENIIKDETLREILKYSDVLVDGAYVDELRDISLPFKGSSNQRIIDVQKSLAENKIILWEEV